MRLIGAVAGLLLAAGAASPNLPPCRGTLCGFDRPEDISRIPGTSWMVVSQQRPTQPLVLVDTSSPHARRAVGIPSLGRATIGEAACARPPDAVHPRGHGVGRMNGERVLALINAGPPQRIELFRIEVRGATPAVAWSGCIDVPAGLLLNDVALSNNSTLYATHMFTPPSDEAAAAALTADFVAARPTGHAVRWRAGEGWSRLPGTALSFANGIAISSDDHTLAIGGTFDQAVTLLDLKTGARLRVPVSLQPDNISPRAPQDLPNKFPGDFVVAGHVGVPVSGIDPCRPAAALPCGFPFSVASIGRDGTVVVLFRHDGTMLPGASVAMPAGDQLFVGSAFGDRLAKVKPGAQPVQ